MFNKSHYIIVWITTGFFVLVSILYYTIIQSDISAINIAPKKINSLTVVSWSDIDSWTVNYVLSNGLVLFDTSLPAESKFDYISDESITKFVSAQIPFSNRQYIPSDLVSLQSKWLVVNNSNMKLRAIALKKLDRLAEEFYTMFQDKLVIVSAYRSYSYQVNIAKGCSTTLCARPGFSEHQLGLTIDIFAATTAGKFLSKAEFKKYYERLMQNAHRYGWHNSYQKGVTIDTYQPEPRHRRYLWRELATELYDSQITFAEWYNQQEIEKIV